MRTTKKARGTASASDTPVDRGEPLIALVDGPMANQWFWLSDWRELRQSARDMAERGQQEDRCLRYRETGSEVAHRTNDAWVGRAWTYEPEGERP